MAITRHAAYNALLTRIRSLVTAVVDSSGVYLAAVPFLDSGQKAPYIQIVPGVVSEKQTRSGAGGLRIEEFDVTVWQRLFQDYADQETELIADASQGLMQLMATIDGTDDTPGLTNMNLLTELTPLSLDGTITWLRGSAAARDGDHPGWVFAADTYSMLYTVSRERTPT